MLLTDRQTNWLSDGLQKLLEWLFATKNVTWTFRTFLCSYKVLVHLYIFNVLQRPRTRNLASVTMNPSNQANNISKQLVSGILKDLTSQNQRDTLQPVLLECQHFHDSHDYRHDYWQLRVLSEVDGWEASAATPALSWPCNTTHYTVTPSTNPVRQHCSW